MGTGVFLCGRVVIYGKKGAGTPRNGAPAFSAQTRIDTPAGNRHRARVLNPTTRVSVRWGFELSNQ
jgi:hypothetical protein